MNNEYNNIGIEPSENNSIEQPIPVTGVPVTEPTPVVSETPQVDSTVSNNEEMAQPETTVSTSEIPTNTNDAKQTTNIRTIIILAVILVVGAIIGVVFFVTGKSSSGGIFSSGEKITAKEIEAYDIKSIARWGNLSLGVSYLIPDLFEEGEGYPSDIYLHGHNFGPIYSSIFVEKSLEGSKDLKTLPLDIFKEKTMDKYHYEGGYGHTSFFTRKLESIDKTENYTIGNISAVYFESNELEGLYQSDEKCMYLGYSFKYNNDYYSVYGFIHYSPSDKEQAKSEMTKKLQYIINSFKPYNKGESFYDLDNNYNLKEITGSCGVADTPDSSKEKMTVVINTEIQGSNGSYRDLLLLDGKLNNWDGKYDTIYDSLMNSSDYLYESSHKVAFVHVCHDRETDVSRVCSTNTIIKEDDETINGIKMKKYLIKTSFAKKETYYSVYTFTINDAPYLYTVALSHYVDGIESSEITEEQRKVHINNVDLIGSTYIRSLRLLKYDNSLSETKNSYKYKDYCD